MHSTLYPHRTSIPVYRQGENLRRRTGKILQGARLRRDKTSMVAKLSGAGVPQVNCEYKPFDYELYPLKVHKEPFPSHSRLRRRNLSDGIGFRRQSVRNFLKDGRLLSKDGRHSHGFQSFVRAFPVTRGASSAERCRMKRRKAPAFPLGDGPTG